MSKNIWVDATAATRADCKSVTIRTIGGSSPSLPKKTHQYCRKVLMAHCKFDYLMNGRFLECLTFSDVSHRR